MSDIAPRIHIENSLISSMKSDIDTHTMSIGSFINKYPQYIIPFVSVLCLILIILYRRKRSNQEESKL